MLTFSKVIQIAFLDIDHARNFKFTCLLFSMQCQLTQTFAWHDCRKAKITNCLWF